jgi:Zn-dependent protease
MAYGGYGGGSGGPRRPRRRFQLDQRTTIIVVIAVALIAILLRTHKISRFEIIYFCVLIPSIILHEISHGVVALAFGDDTAKRAGRLTLNPIRHVDPVGTLLVPAVLSLSGIGAYGWAKPVPVSTNRLRSPRNHTVVVSLVGPVTNFVLAGLVGLAYVLVTPQVIRQIVSTGGFYPPGLLSQILFLAGIANIVLGVFNLIPCPPLDGAAVLERLLPARVLPEYYRLQPALMFLPFVLILFFHNQWAQLIGHVINWWSGLLV